MKAGLRVLDAGGAATLQDGGRCGYQRFSVPISGALDSVSWRISNIVAGNPADTAALEIIGSGLTLKIEAERVHIAVAGAAPPLAIEGEKGLVRLPALRSALVKRGDVLRLGPPKNGAVYYFAAEGGFDVPSVLGSVSTYVRSKLGGYKGRALLPGDFLPLSLNAATVSFPRVLDVSVSALEVLRVMRGPNAEWFSDEAFETLFSSSYTVSHASDRMGLRLQGPAVRPAKAGELASQGTTAGAMQIAADGQPIMLLSDRQTTGGYPRIATVIGADVPAAGRLAAGMAVKFEEVSRDLALRALRDQRDWLESLPSMLRPLPGDLLSSEHLLGHNLIGGVIAG